MHDFLLETARICGRIPAEDIERMAETLAGIKGRIYLIGLGGSLANCIHMAADLRKICELDAVAPDNIAELTAWANDEGLERMFDGYLRNIGSNDALFVLSVGGGVAEVSQAISWAVIRASLEGIPILGIVGPNGGITWDKGTCVIRIPVTDKNITPHTEAFQAILWHCLVTILQKRPTKW